MFHEVFFIVVANRAGTGSDGGVSDAAAVGLQKAETPALQAVLAIESRLAAGGELMSFYVDEGAGGDGDIAPGPGLSRRDRWRRRSCGNRLIPPLGSMVLQGQDHVYVLAQPEDKRLIYLMFGRPEAE